MPKKSRKFIYILLVLLIFFIGIIVLVLQKKEFKSGFNNADYTHYENLIEKNGARQAYETMLNENYGKNFVDMHIQVHIMGELLYTTQGLPGIEICDQTSDFGCYHSFVMAAIQDKGLSSIDQIREICSKQLVNNANIPCSHGVGHGFIGYYGYTLPALTSSLSACSTYFEKHSKNERISCTLGVFMEFNSYFERDHHEIVDLKHRDIEKDDKFHPCFTLEDKYQKACVFYQPQVWFTSLKLSPNEMVLNCSKLPVDYREVCIMGVGSILAVHYTFDKTIGYCKEMSKESQPICIRSAISAYQFYYPKEYDSQIDKYCKSTTDSSHCDLLRPLDYL